MKTKTFILTLCILASSVGISLAQKKQMKDIDPAARAEKMTSKMQEHLELSDEQMKKVNTINLVMVTKKQAMKKEAASEKKQKKDSMKALRKEYDSELKKVLDDRQYEKFQMQQEKRMEEKKSEHPKNKK